MKNIRFYLVALSLFLVGAVSAQQTSGGISQDMLNQIKKSYEGTATDKALRNIINKNDISLLVQNADRANTIDTYFSNKVESKGISNQRSSGRCWLFCGLNVLRSKAIAKHNLGDFQFSQDYVFFYDQLEKANLFLQGIIDTREKLLNDQTVVWLLKNPIGDGGQFTGIADLLTKYGVVPADVMPETNSSNNTRGMSSVIALKLKEQALQLRDMSAAGKKLSDLEKSKTEMLGTIYRILVLNLGEPPTSFTWSRKDDKGKTIETKTYTPKQFFDEYVGDDLKHNYVMLMNDPSRDFYKLYEVEYDRHVYDGENWTYVNLPIEDIKAMAISSIKDSTSMYFSCDVGKFLDRTRGYLELGAEEYAPLFGTTFNMNKKQRIQTFSSGSSHAICLMAVDLDEKGQPKKWMVENSWGPGANNGHLIMTDDWFNEYMFRLVVNKKYITDKVREIMKQTPIKLPPWDPMFAEED